MNIKKVLVSAAATAILLGAAAGSAFAAMPFMDGGFELGAVPGAFITVSGGDSTSIPNWTVVSGSVDYIGSYWTPSEGTKSLDMSGNEAGSISQTFDTIPGHMYTVSFDMAGNPDGEPAQKTMDVSVDAVGALPQSYMFDTTGYTTFNMGWTAEIYNFTASGASTTLNFTSTVNTAYGPALDNVVVTDVTPVLTNKDQCKNGGWMTFVAPSFKNQGDCVSYVQSNPKAIGNKTK